MAHGFASIVLRRFNPHVFEGRAENPSTTHAGHGLAQWVLIDEHGIAREWSTWRCGVVEQAKLLGLELGLGDVGPDNAGSASVVMPCPAYDGQNRARGAA